MTLSQQYAPLSLVKVCGLMRNNSDAKQANGTHTSTVQQTQGTHGPDTAGCLLAHVTSLLAQQDKDAWMQVRLAVTIEPTGHEVWENLVNTRLPIDVPSS